MGIRRESVKPVAVFLDRDGVLTKLIFHRESAEYGAPLNIRQLKICPGAAVSLRKLCDLGYKLFVISNQPDYAKGLTSLADIRAVNRKVCYYFSARGIKFSGYYYCLHHPQAKVRQLRRVCRCRKPAPLFVMDASKKYRLDLKRSWFVGDSDTDVLCGQASGTRTILIKDENSSDKRGKSRPDFFAVDINDASRIIEENCK